MQHFILTRFNLRLWPHNKRGESTRTEEWLRHRVALFERYCLPSVAGQTCKDFIWILLMDNESPQWLIDRSKQWREICPQIKFIGVSPDNSRRFAGVFKYVINQLRTNKEERCITTYFDNDDALSCDFVADVQQRLSNAKSDTVLSYIHGLQFFTELGIATKILFKHNHFLTLVEDGEEVKTIFGYGGHYYIWKQKELQLIYVDPVHPMWMEVVHEGNVDNDIWMTYDTRLVSTDPIGRFSFKDVHYSKSPYSVFIFRFIPRSVRIFFVHVKHKLFGHDWWK